MQTLIALRIRIVEYVGQAAFEPFQKKLESFERDILIHDPGILSSHAVNVAANHHDPISIDFPPFNPPNLPSATAAGFFSD
ncbi:MAG: hypothetical protein WBN75_09090 [Verrucomicrobiia bacterium]|jgi:hypothetical protein